MGNLLNKVVEYQISPHRVLFLGLDAAGKTTILYKLAKNEPITTIPTIGFNVETFNFQGFQVNAWDVGGRSNLRALWRHYYPGTEGIVYVIDANDHERLEEAVEQLKRHLSEELLLGIPVLIFANKGDLPNALTVNQISDTLRNEFTRSSRKWKVVATIGTTGAGLKEGMSWLRDSIQAKS